MADRNQNKHCKESCKNNPFKIAKKRVKGIELSYAVWEAVLQSRPRYEVRMQAELNDVPDNRRHLIRFETLVARPAEELEKYAALELGNFAPVEERMIAAAAKANPSIRARYRRRTSGRKA